MSLTGPVFAKGGRVRWRALARLPLILILITGLALVGRGAVIPAKAVLAQILLERAFVRSLSTQAPVKAWPWADSAPVARISVPRLDVTEIVLSGGSGEAMAFGPTLMPGGAAPGERGTAVFAAHRDTHFRFLKDVRPGDVVVVDGIDGSRASYRVLGGQVVRHDRFAIDRHTRVPMIALTTCWPFGSDVHGPWRYVVTARRV